MTPTAKQLAAMILQAEGQTSKAIADSFDISQKSVEDRIYLGRKKIGQMTLVGMVRWLVGHKYVDAIVCFMLLTCPAWCQPTPHISLRLTAASTNTILIQWQQSPTPDIMENVIYFGTNSDASGGGYYVTATPCTMLFKTLVGPRGTRWYCTVTAIDANGDESGDSNVAHWPPYPPVLTGVTITGIGPVKQSSDMAHWYDFTNSLPATLPVEEGNHYWRGTNLNLAPIWFQPE